METDESSMPFADPALYILLHVSNIAVPLFIWFVGHRFVCHARWSPVPTPHPTHVVMPC